MQETATQSPTPAEAPVGIAAEALRAEAWAGEPFLREGEDADVALAPGTARRRVLDDAVAELDGGATEPSTDWKVRYALMLALERILSGKPPRLPFGAGLRRLQ